MEFGDNPIDSVTVTLAVSGAKPTALATICADPMATPCTVGFAAGICTPPGPKISRLTVATAGFVLNSETVTPPAGAGTPRLSGRPTSTPGATTTDDPRLIRLLDVAVMSSVDVAYAGAVAVTVAEPAEIPEMVNDPD